ncbi:hypothetical protein HU200_062902 [Digitaria exilis]|uniref:Uncharacterized protein n=1 Tax=Digitaria exilis TaxID=1010633 RepID=A0A835AC64_9POAL|nr:hypothetical protein HU200_062902 [Digitaria exilis]
MDAPRGGGGHARRPAPSGAGVDQRRVAAQQAMARMEEMMLAHAGAAGEFSIILDAPLPSLQQYRRHPEPQQPSKGASPARRVGREGAGGGGRDEAAVPARLRRDGSGHDALADARRPSRRDADAGARRERPAGGAARGEEEKREEVEAPVRLVAGPRSVRRPVSRGATPPPAPRSDEAKRAVAEEAEEEEMPLQLLARGGRSSIATRPAEAAAPPPPPEAVETAVAAARPSSRRSRREVGVKPAVSDVTSNADSDVESVGRWSSRGSEDGGEDAVALPKPLAAVVARDRSRSNSPAISNLHVTRAIVRKYGVCCRNGVDSAGVNRPPSTGRSTFAPPVGANVRPLQAVEMPNGTPRDRRAVYPDPTFAQSTRSRDSHDSSTLTEELGLAEEQLRQSEARTAELEKQQEIRKALISKNGKSEELTALQQQLQAAREEASAALKKLKESESETKDLRTMTRRMILSKEEMEEVVMKRCWLARYWGLAVQYGIYPDISMSKHEYWSSLAPLPFEYVTSAGQRAKNGSETGSDGPEDADKLVHDLTVTAGEGNVETMLSVDKGLQELAFLKVLIFSLYYSSAHVILVHNKSLAVSSTSGSRFKVAVCPLSVIILLTLLIISKVEDAVLFALAQHHRSNVAGPADPDIISSGDEKFTEAFDLSKDEEEDAWLIYFWRRAKTHNVEEDIADERLQMWIDRNEQQPTSHDAVDGILHFLANLRYPFCWHHASRFSCKKLKPQVLSLIMKLNPAATCTLCILLFLFLTYIFSYTVEQGLHELRKLGIEQLLWELSRHEMNLTKDDPSDVEDLT